MSPFQSVAVLAFLYYFLRCFHSRRRIPTTVRKVRGWYEKSMVRIVHGTKSPQMVRNVYGTKSLWYEKSGSPPVLLPAGVHSMFHKLTSPPVCTRCKYLPCIRPPGRLSIFLVFRRWIIIFKFVAYSPPWKIMFSVFFCRISSTFD